MLLKVLPCYYKKVLDMEINTEEREILQKRFRDYISEHNTSTECHADICVMVYPVVFDIDMGQSYQIKAVIEEIRTDSDYLKNKSKPELPVIYFSVKGFVGRKVFQNVTEHTGLIVIDIDKKDNPDTDFSELKNRFGRDRHVLACFRSPSGGLKAVFNTNIKDKQHHKVYFHAISRYVLETHPEIIKIDTSGSNINRACYMPYDADAYYNPNSYRYCLSDQQIIEISKEIKKKNLYSNSLKPILEVSDYSFDDHYNNILYLLKNRTSMGIRAQKRTSMGIEDNQSGSSCNTINEKRTSVGMGENLDYSSPDIDTIEKRTSMGIRSSSNSNASNEKRTSVGLYDSVFNNYRYNNIIDYIMCTDVPFFETALWKRSYPYKLDNETFLDENYFGVNTQEPICTENTKGFEDTNGFCYCEVKIPKDGINIGFRHKTLASWSMKFIFNNPFCHPKRLVEYMQYINQRHCLDPKPDINPRPSDDEVKNIVMLNYQKFLCGELDFNKAIRKNHKNTGSMKKYVFRSRNYVETNDIEKHREGHQGFTKARRYKKVMTYAEAIKTLMNGTRITYKGIAKQMGITERHLRRIRGDEEYRDFFEIQKKLMNEYNASLMKNGVDEDVLDLGQDIIENHKNILKPDPEKTKDKDKGLSDEQKNRIYHRIYSNMLTGCSTEKETQLQKLFQSKILSFKTCEQRILMLDVSEVSNDDFWTHSSLESQLVNLINELES